MIHINKNLLKFASVAVMLTSGLFIVLAKFLPLFLQHSVYFCQQFIHSFSIRIPNELGYIIPAVGAVLTITLVYKLLSVYREVKNLRKQLTSYKKTNKGLQKLLKKLNLQDLVLVIESEKPFAFCVGIRNQKIYLSTTLLSIMSKAELEAILLHERYHLKNKDSVILLLASLLKILFPFFPVVADLLTNYKISREIEADQDTVHILGTSTPVISVLRKFLIFPSPAFANATAIADYVTLEPRINALVYKKTSFAKFKLSNIGISLLSLLIFVGIVATPVNAIEMKMPQQKATMLCLQGAACAKWCQEHNTLLPYSTNYSHSTNASYMNASEK